MIKILYTSFLYKCIGIFFIYFTFQFTRIPGTEGIGNFVGGFGGEKNSPATVYPVSITEEGNLKIEV